MCQGCWYEVYEQGHLALGGGKHECLNVFVWYESLALREEKECQSVFVW